MTFLTYAPKDRRDYLSSDLSIEEEFKEEMENIAILGSLYKPTESDNFGSLSTDRMFRIEGTFRRTDSYNTNSVPSNSFVNEIQSS